MPCRATPRRERVSVAGFTAEIVSFRDEAAHGAEEEKAIAALPALRVPSESDYELS